MLVLLTPSKTMDFSAPSPTYVVPTVPVFDAQAKDLRQFFAALPVAEFRRIMKTSNTLTVASQRLFLEAVRKPALWAYKGDVFKGVCADTLSRDDAQFAQRHILIPSALYGLVRPYDAVQPYRLEMRANVAIGEVKTMYDFWGDSLAQYVASYWDNELLVLSSQEYARAVVRHLPLNVRVVTPIFLDRKKDGRIAQVPIYNKMMRGVMARWVIDHRISKLADIPIFNEQGYAYDEQRSTSEMPVFRREVMTPLRFTE